MSSGDQDSRQDVRADTLPLSLSHTNVKDTQQDVRAIRRKSNFTILLLLTLYY